MDVFSDELTGCCGVAGMAAKQRVAARIIGKGVGKGRSFIMLLLKMAEKSETELSTAHQKTLPIPSARVVGILSPIYSSCNLRPRRSAPKDGRWCKEHGAKGLSKRPNEAAVEDELSDVVGDE